MVAFIVFVRLLGRGLEFDELSDKFVSPCAQDNTPLAGSSAGAIACAIIASGVGMREALDATKFLADDCRLKGTAFRLGVCMLHYRPRLSIGYRACG